MSIEKNKLKFTKSDVTDWDHASDHEDGGSDLIQSIRLDQALGSDHTATGLFIQGTVENDVAFPDILYLNSNGRYDKADADLTTTMPCVAMAMETILALATGKLLILGYVRDDTWNWTVGDQAGVIWVDVTAGSPTQTKPSGSGDQVQAIGIAISADIMFFKPDITWLEIS